VDGSGRLTKRNRKYLQKFDPASTDIFSAPMPTSSQPGLEDTPPVAHLQLAQPKPPVELVMRGAPEDQTTLQVFHATGTRQPEPNPIPMLEDFPAIGPSQLRPVPNPAPMLLNSPGTGPDRKARPLAGALNTKPKLKPFRYNRNPPCQWSMAFSKLFFDDSFVISLSSLPFPFSVLT
jgi:hypothetical protein